MRIRFDEQLKQLNKEMINMGTMIEKSIGDAVKALMKQDVELAQKVMAGDEEIDRTERKIEDLCLRLLLQQQPVARDLRNISAAGGQRSSHHLRRFKNDHRHGENRRSCNRYFRTGDCSFRENIR